MSLIFPHHFLCFLWETTAKSTSTQRATQLNLDKFRDIYRPISSILFSIEIQVYLLFPPELYIFQFNTSAHLYIFEIPSFSFILYSFMFISLYFILSRSPYCGHICKTKEQYALKQWPLPKPLTVIKDETYSYCYSILDKKINNQELCGTFAELHDFWCISIIIIIAIHTISFRIYIDK